MSYFPEDERFLYTSDEGGDELDHVYVRHPDGAVIDLTPGRGHKPVFLTWAQDDASFYLGTNERDRRFLDIYAYDPETYERTLIFQNDDGFDFFAPIAFHARYLALAKMQGNADTDLYLFERETGQTRRLTNDAEPVRNMPQAFSPDGRYLYYLTDKDHEFMYLVRHDLEHGTVKEVVKVDWDLLYASFDGLEASGILYRPHQAGPEHPAPALIYAHGRTNGQSRFRYNALLQYLVNHGYAVYAVNQRGSSGYGKTFEHLNDGKQAEGDLDDIVEGKAMLAGLDWIDGARVGIYGRTVGGFMTLAALTFRPDVFDAGVDLFGVSNWQRTMQNFPPWWTSYRTYFEQEVGAMDDEVLLRAKSPLFHAAQIKKPLL